MITQGRNRVGVALASLLAFGSMTAALVSSCTGPEADYRDRLAAVNFVALPDTVQIGQTFLVSIHTSTPSSAWKQGHDEVREIENGYRIVPHDREPTGSGPMVGDVGHYTHEVTLTLQTVGVAEIQIAHALANASGGDSTGTMVRHVVVQAAPGNTTD